MQILNFAALSLAAVAATVLGQTANETCDSEGAYVCQNFSDNTNSTILICASSQWQLVAECSEDESCVIESNGGVTCQ